LAEKREMIRPALWRRPCTATHWFIFHSRSEGDILKQMIRHHSSLIAPLNQALGHHPRGTEKVNQEVAQPCFFVLRWEREKPFHYQCLLPA